MKKYLSIILSLVLALAMVFSLVACGGDDSSSDDDDSSESSSSSSSSSDDSSDADSDTSSDESKTDKKPANTDSIVGDWTGKVGLIDENDEYISYGNVEITFEEDGTYSMKFDIRSVVEAEYEGFDEYLEEEGITLEEYLEENGYSTYEELIQAEIDFMIENGYDEPETGEYFFDGEVFEFGGDELDFEFDGNKLVLYDYDEYTTDIIEFERV